MLNSTTSDQNVVCPCPVSHKTKHQNENGRENQYIKRNLFVKVKPQNAGKKAHALRIAELFVKDTVSIYDAKDRVAFFFAKKSLTGKGSCDLRQSFGCMSHKQSNETQNSHLCELNFHRQTARIQTSERCQGRNDFEACQSEERQAREMRGRDRVNHPLLHR